MLKKETADSPETTNKSLQVHYLVISCDRVENCVLSMSQEKSTGMRKKFCANVK
jgi:hypothetical protein